MITIDIIDCPNKDIIGATTFYTNLIEIGSTNGDILLLSSEYINHLFYLEVVDGFIQIIPNPNIDYFLVNGKRSLSQRKLQKGDSIKYKTFEFAVKDFSFTEKPTYNKMVTDNFGKLDEEDPLYKLLVNLDQELIDLEDASN